MRKPVKKKQHSWHARTHARTHTRVHRTLHLPLYKDSDPDATAPQPPPPPIGWLVLDVTCPSTLRCSKGKRLMALFFVLIFYADVLMCTQYLMGVALYLKAMVLLRLVAKTNGTTFPSDATLKPPTTICVQAIEDDDGAVEERSSDQASLKLLMTHPELRKRQVVSKRIDIYISISLYLYSGVYNNAYHDIYTYQFICRPC